MHRVICQWAPWTAMAQPYGLDSAILIAGPGVHRHRVGVIEEQRARLGHFADVAAEIEHRGKSCAGHNMMPPAQSVTAKRHWSIPVGAGEYRCRVGKLRGRPGGSCR